MNKNNNLQYSDMPFKYQCIMFIVFSFVLMLFCTKSSPLFVFNDWYDANVYFTMGKGMMNGYVPYVDLIDNKGPLLYFIYGVAWLFDHTGFLGVYLFQSLFLAISIIFMYRLALLFITNKHIAFLVAVCSPIPMLIERFYAENYDFGGGGPDEFCRALMIVSLFYFTLLYVKPDDYKLCHTFLQGILFMCVFLIKFNLTVFWVGFILSFSVELLYKKKFSFLIKHMVCFITGAFITAVPYLIYGIFTKSLKAFVNTYFLYNWTYVNPNNHPFLKALESIISAIGKMGSLLGFSLLFSVGLVFVFFVCKTGFKIGYSTSLLLLFTAIYYTTVRFATIHIPFTIAILFGIIAVGVLVERYIKKCRFHMSMTLVGSVLIIGITIHLNGLTTYDLFLTEQPAAQQQIAEVMWERTKNHSPTLLEIDSLDSGFYTAAGIIPDEPYFFIYNIAHEVYSYPRDAQKKAVEEGHSEFVICGTAELSTSYNPYNIIELYDEVYVVQGTGYQSNLFYHLFQLRAMD